MTVRNFDSCKPHLFSGLRPPQHADGLRQALQHVRRCGPHCMPQLELISVCCGAASTSGWKVKPFTENKKDKRVRLLDNSPTAVGPERNKGRRRGWKNFETSWKWSSGTAFLARRKIIWLGYWLFVRHLRTKKYFEHIEMNNLRFSVKISSINFSLKCSYLHNSLKILTSPPITYFLP